MICRRRGEFDAGGRCVADSAAYLLAGRPDFQLGSGGEGGFETHQAKQWRFGAGCFPALHGGTPAGVA
jgi:hypothetical protein